MTNIRTNKLLVLILSSILLSFHTLALADAPLKSTLNLNKEQAKEVAAIQKETRDAIRPVRGKLHKEERKLRRANNANDSALIAEQEAIIIPLQEEMKAIHDNEEAKIRALLTPEQTAKYEDWLRKRNAMAGSSRDVKEY